MAVRIAVSTLLEILAAHNTEAGSRYGVSTLLEILGWHSAAEANRFGMVSTLLEILEC